jgi:hypothetical protein
MGNHYHGELDDEGNLINIYRCVCVFRCVCVCVCVCVV